MRKNSFFCLFLLFIFISPTTTADWMVVDTETVDVFLPHGGDGEPKIKIGTLCFGDTVEVIKRRDGWALVHPPASIQYEQDAIVIDHSNQCLVLSKSVKEIFLLSGVFISSTPKGWGGDSFPVSKQLPTVGSLKKWSVVGFKSAHRLQNGGVVYVVGFPEDIVVSIKEDHLGFKEEDFVGFQNNLDSGVLKNPKVVVSETKTQNTTKDIVNKKLLSLNKQLEKIKKEHVSLGIIQELWGHYKNLKEDGQELDPLSPTMINLQKNMDYIELLYETMVGGKELSYRFISAQQTSEDVFVQGQGLKGGKTYIGEGVVSLSSVYNGKTKPKLFRLLHPKTKRTIGYLEPSKRFDFISLLGQRVGVVGLTKINPILGVRVLKPKQIDLLGNNEKKQNPINPYKLMGEGGDWVDKGNQKK